MLRVRVTDSELDLIAARGYEGANERGDRGAMGSAVSAFVSDILFNGHQR